MPEKLIPMHGTSSAADEYTGSKSEITMDETNNTIRVHDGAKAGGHALARLDQVSEQLQADWGTTEVEDKSFIKNKPTNLSDFDNDQVFISEAPEDGNQYVRKDTDWEEIVVEQSDWTETDNTSAAYVHNKITPSTVLEVEDPTSEDTYITPKVLKDLTKVAIGLDAGKILQGNNSVAIGDEAGRDTQGNSAVSIGDAAGKADQGNYSVAVGRNSALTNQGNSSVAVGDTSGRTNQGRSAVAVGTYAGVQGQEDYAVAVGSGAGGTNQGLSSVSIGPTSGANEQGQYSVAVGSGSGENGQGNGAVSVGKNAGETTQGDYAIALGENAGRSSQGGGSVAIGRSSGDTSQQSNAVAVGSSAGREDQETNAVAVGYLAGDIAQGTEAVAIGNEAGKGTQRSGAVAIGGESGSVSQGTKSVAIGFESGNGYQGSTSVAVGYQSGQTNQSTASVAVGVRSGQTNQSGSAVAVGNEAGQTSQGISAVAVGKRSGETSQGQAAIAIGDSAGNSLQGAGAIAIGLAAGASNQEAQGVHIKTTDFDMEYLPSTKVLDFTNADGDLDLTVNGVAVGGGGINAPYSRLFIDCLNDPSAPLVKPDGTVTTIGGIGGKLMGRSKYKIPNSFYFETTKESSSNSSALYLMFCPITTNALGDTTDFTKGFGIRFLQTSSENIVSVGTVVGTSLTDRIISVNSATDSFPCNVGDTIGFSVQPDGLDMHIIANNITQGTTLTHTHNDGATNWSNVLLDFSVQMSGISNGSYTLNTGQSEFLGDSQGFPVLDHTPLGVNRSLVTLWEGSKNTPNITNDYIVKGAGNWYITSGSSTPFLVTVSNLQTRHIVEQTTANFIGNTMAVTAVTTQAGMSSMSTIQNDINLSSNQVGLVNIPVTKIEYAPL